MRQWLKAGVMEDEAFHETTEGTPQGGVISPLLLNIALHGMEAALDIQRSAREEITGPRAVVRYADDFVVFCESQTDALAVKDQILPAWLSERGLVLSEEKTRIVHLSEGFDFLGFTVRHYPVPKSRLGFKLLIKPSKKAVKSFMMKVKEIWLRLKGQPIGAVLRWLNPVIRGWANYHRRVVAKKTFSKLDFWMYHRERRYAKHTHPNKGWKWRFEKYWGRLNPQRQDRYVFGNKPAKAYLMKLAWFPIRRHPLVKGRASPDDASLREYWWKRREVNAQHLSAGDRKLARRQQWKCRICGTFLINGEELHRHHKQARAHGGPDTFENRELVHLFCHQQETYRQFYGRQADC